MLEDAIKRGVTESVVEQAALDLLDSLGWAVKHGPENSPGELYAEREDYGEVVLKQRRRDGLARLNPDLPPKAMEEASRRLMRPEDRPRPTRYSGLTSLTALSKNTQYGE